MSLQLCRHSHHHRHRVIKSLECKENRSHLNCVAKRTRVRGMCSIHHSIHFKATLRFYHFIGLVCLMFYLDFSKTFSSTLLLLCFGNNLEKVKNFDNFSTSFRFWCICNILSNANASSHASLIIEAPFSMHFNPITEMKICRIYNNWLGEYKKCCT